MHLNRRSVNLGPWNGSLVSRIGCFNASLEASIQAIDVVRLCLMYDALGHTSCHLSVMYRVIQYYGVRAGSGTWSWSRDLSSFVTQLSNPVTNRSGAIGALVPSSRYREGVELTTLMQSTYLGR